MSVNLTQKHLHKHTQNVGSNVWVYLMAQSNWHIKLTITPSHPYFPIMLFAYGNFGPMAKWRSLNSMGSQRVGHDWLTVSQLSCEWLKSKTFQTFFSNLNWASNIICTIFYISRNDWCLPIDGQLWLPSSQCCFSVCMSTVETANWEWLEVNLLILIINLTIKNIFQANENNNKIGVTILISDRITFKLKMVKRSQGDYIVIKG